MIHVITAFTRKQNKELMINHLKDTGIKWTVLLNEDIKFPSWVEVIHMLPDPSGYDCYARFNQYFRRGFLEDETQYMFLNDDDFVENNFWNKIPSDYDVIFVSMKRGDHTIYHGNSTLLAKEENIFCCNVGLEQYIVKGKILKNHYFDMNSGADGLLAEKLVKYENKLFLPEVYVLFNYLEDGRWDSFKR